MRETFASLAKTGDDDVEIVVCESCDAEAWDEYVRTTPEATVCHAFSWRFIIERCYGHSPVYLLARKEGTVRGILPLFLVKSRLFGSSLSSLPFLDYAGICADTDGLADQLQCRALQLVRQCGADLLEMRQCRRAVGEGVRLDKVGMRLDIACGGAELWRSLSPKVRNQVRKAQKSGLEATVGGPEHLDEFYSVFATNMRDLGSPVHSRKFFDAMVSMFGQNVKVTLVRHGNKVLAGLICLLFKETASIPWASSLKQYNSLCPNNLAYWTTIEYVAGQGYKCFDFGRSSVNSGTYHFKRQWGAAPVQIYWQTLAPNGNTPTSLSADDFKLKFAMEMWKRLPVAVTAVLGPAVRKYITN
jgi:FemAB-related protein (PEP-CTERM system-associated)